MKNCFLSLLLICFSVGLFTQQSYGNNIIEHYFHDSPRPGVTQAVIDKNPDAVWQNTIGGAVYGASSTLLNIAAFGPAYKPHDTYYSHDREGQTTYRKGGLLLHGGQGLTLGHSLGVSGEDDVLIGTEAHESTHIWQQNKMGWANFYGKTITSYISAFFKYGTINNLYNTQGTLEWQADRASYYYMRNIR